MTMTRARSAQSEAASSAATTLVIFQYDSRQMSIAKARRRSDGYPRTTTMKSADRLLYAKC